MPKLPVYNNCTPLNLTAENLLSARKTIRHIIDNLSFLDIRLQQTPNFTDVHTHIGLLENDFAEITKLLRYDTVLAEEHEQRNQELCEAHRRIRELEEQLGQDGVTKDGVTVWEAGDRTITLTETDAGCEFCLSERQESYYRFCVCRKSGRDRSAGRTFR